MKRTSSLTLDGLHVDTTRVHDLSLRVQFDKGGPRAFGLAPAQSQPVQVGAFVGSVRRGGSCNCCTLSLTPHGDGTHTECVGHLLADDVHVVDVLHAPLLRALVVTVVPALLADVDDEVAGNHAPTDRVIDVDRLGEAIARARLSAPQDFVPEALVIRTDSHAARTALMHSESNPTYVTLDAAAFLLQCNMEHVLVDLPSFDRADDGGFLGAHRVFFGLAPGVTSTDVPCTRTITEMITVGDDVSDGAYALSLQLAPLAGDAVPSRPLLFALGENP
jgi:hypothetical protein